MEYRPLEEWEYPEPDDTEAEDYSETLNCPVCGTDVYEDAECCPACGEYIQFTTHRLSGWPWWFVAFGLIGVFAVILTFIL
tara:strand:- start:219 stop:461 length:243 start_codon:yes stop_codon:yes gene_type:complete